jgi:hypothetical protein
MAGKNTAAFGIYSDRTAVENAVDALKAAGYRIKSGGILLSVHCDNSEWTKKANGILERTGAEDVSSTGESAADFSKSDRPMLRSDAPTGQNPTIDPTLPRDKKIS